MTHLSVSLGHRGISLGHRDDLDAEQWLRDVVLPLSLPDLTACTHLMREPYPHVALSFAGTGLDSAALPPVPPELRDAATAAAAEHATRRSGRAVYFAGVERLVGTITVSELLDWSAIDQVAVLGGAPAQPETRIHTRDFVRPQWRNGQLVLTTQPARGGILVPFEMPDPTPCCADH
ncbi:hypothetical protein ACIBF5_26090 [Micromonospora sp. NPDC050417]|uniref:hypothetical protein n=1 Tax=Micromonospora sp. NPDC050417 TaxID=3364280 RepID=UPI0037B002A6